MWELVPEEFRDREHLQQIHQRIKGFAVLIAAIFIAVALACFLGSRHAGGLAVRVAVPVAAALAAFALFSLMTRRRKLTEVDPTHIMTFIESCDRDPTGRDSARVSSLVAELYAGQGFLTREQFARMTAMLHGQARSHSSAADLQLPFDENHELA